MFDTRQTIVTELNNGPVVTVFCEAASDAIG
jgi:hypothetical protein